MNPNIDELTALLYPHKVSVSAASRIECLRSSAVIFGRDILQSAPESNERDIAIYHLVDALMWATKAISMHKAEWDTGGE